MKSRTLLIAALTLAVSPAAAQSSLPSVSVREAYERLKSGKSILIDIRRPEEWKETGVAEGAIPLDMTSPTFLDRLTALRREHADKAIDIICRTANRTQRVQEILFRRGWSEIVNVRGGMVGNPGNPGWIMERLPLTRIN